MNICFTDTVSTSTVDFSLILRQVINIAAKNSIDIISANHLKPAYSLPFPSIYTHCIVIIVTSAEPTPAQERAIVDIFSLSLPPSVNAGIIDQ